LLNIRFFSFIIIFILSSQNLNAGFFSDLFDTQHPDVQITQEDPIIIEEDEYEQKPLFKDDKLKNDKYEEEVISADDYVDSIDEPTDIEVFSNEENSRAFDENEQEISFDDEDAFVKSQSIFLSFVEKPEKIYLSQHAILKLKAVVTDENVDSMSTVFLNHKKISILNSNNPWIKTSSNSYENSFIIKALSTSAAMPNIKVNITTSNGKTYSEVLPSYKPKIVALREDKEFCLVLSKDLTLTSHNQKKYDEKTNIVVLEIRANGANLEDFHIPYAIRDGIDEMKYDKGAQIIYYFAIVPNDIKVFKFKYFDIMSNKYNIVSFPMKLQDSSVSTQTDLNPEENRFRFYKFVLLVVLAVIFFLFYLKTKNILLLAIALIIGFFSLYHRLPISKIILDKNVQLRILPTKNSTIFYTTTQETNADILLKKDGYIKILLPNKKIGWIDEDITKN